MKPSTQLFEHRYVPAQSPRKPEKLLIVLHGLGDSLRGFSFFPQELNLPELSFLLLNAPDPYHGGYSWFDFLGDPEPGVLRSRALLLQLLEELRAQGFAPENLFLFGFSQGCLMAVDAGLRCPDLLGGICGVSGYVAFEEEYPEAFSPVARQQHFLITHGKRDPVVPFEPATGQFSRLKKMGLNMEIRAYEKEHTLLPGEIRHIAEWLEKRMAASP